MGDDAATKLQDIIYSFNDKNSGKKKAYEIKLATFFIKMFLMDIHPCWR